MTEVFTKNAKRGEPEIFSVRPTVAYFYADYALAVLKSLVFVLALYLFEKFVRNVVGRETFYVSFWLSLAGGLYFLARTAFRHWQRNAVCYTLTDSVLKVEDGFWHKQTRHIPLGAVQSVTVFAGLKQRLIGCGDVLIEHRQQPNGKVVLRSVSAPKKIAEDILRRMPNTVPATVSNNYRTAPTIASR